MFKVRKWRELNNTVYQKSEEIQKKAIADMAEARRKIKEERERIIEIKDLLKKMPNDEPDLADQLKEELR